MIWVGGAAVVAAVGLYFVGRKAAGAVVDTAGGLLSGNNTLTQGTAYEGRGVIGTLGAGANELSGGLLGEAGSRLGLWVSDLFADDPLSEGFTKQ